MNLHITSVAKQTQIAFLISMDNFLSAKYRNKVGHLHKRVADFMKRKNDPFKVRIQEGKGRVDLYSNQHLIGYYL